MVDFCNNLAIEPADSPFKAEKFAIIIFKCLKLNFELEKNNFLHGKDQNCKVEVLFEKTKQKFENLMTSKLTVYFSDKRN